ncbi:anti-sigma factor [Nocardioides nitrophenolicus]|uniref:anti-sigma factor n=1 Tax=Nocardioides nitrophenolicus TaxID=60489 RepID=UPI00195E03C9|nr:anti-sigma factor [Nocardioides nitrophenolicus]MBM7517338.1 anti-sigma-K factor RskA [Nocardioides nitrophenolicus]
MTDHDQSPGWDAHALSGAYAVDALDDVERARFEAHLAQCADCREEVDGLRETAALLGTADLVSPPAAVRDQVLAGIERIRPLPPRRAGGARTVLRRRTPLLLAVAAAVVLLLGVGVATLQPWAGDEPQQLTAAERILAAPDASRVEKTFPDGSTATVVVSRSEGRALIRTTGMAPAPEGRAYELWLQTPAGEMVPAGLMPDEADTTYVLDGDASRATGVGITVEPDGGSPQPTGDPIALFALDS